MAKKTGNHQNGQNNGTIGDTDNGKSNTNSAGYNAATNSNNGDSRSHEDTTNNK